MRKILFFVLYTIICLTAFTQTQVPYKFKFKNYTYNDGLVHNFTKKCLQDSKGFIWIITQHGLSRFDGLYFKNYEHYYQKEASLPQNDLKDIAIDEDDKIWLSYKNGVSFLDPVTQKFTVIKYNNKPLISNAIYYDKKNKCIWSSNYQAYYKIDSKTLAIKETALKNRVKDVGEINQIFLDSKNRLWILYARSKYHCINISTGIQYLHNENLEPTSIYEDDENRMWMTTWQHGFREIITKDSIHHFKIYGDPNLKYSSGPDDYISRGVAVSESLTGKDILWVIKNTDGILLFDKKQNKFIQQLTYDANSKNGIATDFNEGIFTDKNQNIWLCTWHGLTKVNKKEQQFISWELPELKGQLYNLITGMIPDPNEANYVWMSVNGSGILKYNKLKNEIIERHFYYYNQNKKSFNSVDDNYNWRWTNDLFLDSSNRIWSSSYAGLIKIENEKVIQIPLLNNKKENSYLNTSKEIGRDTIWALGRGGIFEVNSNTGKYNFYEDALTVGNNFFDIEKLNEKELVLASKDGLLLFNRRTKKFSLLTENPDIFKKIWATGIEIIYNKIYISSPQGLRSYDIVTKKMEYIGLKQGIDKVDLNRLITDKENNLWIFTSHGLYKFNPLKKSLESYNTADGIYDLNDDVVKIFPYENNLYIGYRMAITSFNPEKVNINSSKVEPLISELYVNNTLVPIDNNDQQTHSFNHDQNEIRINYTAPDFTNSDKIIFTYRLEGQDKDWVMAGRRRIAIYNNLAPGKYKFSLKAANSSGLWNEKISQFSFAIKTPFWKTIWFQFAIIVLLAFLIYLFYKSRLNQLKKIYEVRSNISRSLHDDVGATLSSINIYSEVARNKTDDVFVKSLIDKVFNSSANAMENMSDIVWYVNPKNDLLENLLIRMHEYAIPLLEAKNIQVNFEENENIKLLKTNMKERQHLYLIFKEAVNNSLKYAEAKNLTIRFLTRHKNLVMEIIDDGKGFITGKENSGNGFKNMCFRAKELKGKLHIDSEPGKGSKVSLEIPLA